MSAVPRVLLAVDASALLLEGEGAFDEAVGAWALVGRPAEAQEEQGWSFRTRAGVVVDEPGTATPMLIGFDDVVLPVKKLRLDGPFAHVVLVGRSSSNDVQLVHSSVSKLHARIEIVPGGDHVLLSDAGSSNGTSVAGVPVQNGERRRAQSGDRIQIGQCNYVLWDNRSLKDMLRMTAPALALKRR